MTKKKQQSARQRILVYLLKNMGRVIEGDELREVSGNISEWARRVRELRDEHGYAILTHKDRANLKPGQYMLETDSRRPAFARMISKETRAFVLERNGYTCQMCGLAASDPDPFDATRKVRLTMGHIIDKAKGGDDSPDNLRAICTNCNEGLQNISPMKPDTKHLLMQVRRAPVDVQRAVFDWLETKYARIWRKPPKE